MNSIFVIQNGIYGEGADTSSHGTDDLSLHYEEQDLTYHNLGHQHDRVSFEDNVPVYTASSAPGQYNEAGVVTFDENSFSNQDTSLYQTHSLGRTVLADVNNFQR